MDANPGKGSHGEGAVRSATALAYEQYHNPDPLVRKEAVNAVCGHHDQETICFLTIALHDTDKEVRNESLLGLVKIGRTAMDALAALLHDPDWRIRYRGAEGLGMIGDPSSARLLVPLTRDGKDHVRYMAAKALGSLSPQDSTDVFLHLIHDENPYVRRMAAEGLGRSRRGDFLSILIQACSIEKDHNTRLAMEQSIVLLRKTGEKNTGDESRS